MASVLILVGAAGCGSDADEPAAPAETPEPVTTEDPTDATTDTTVGPADVEAFTTDFSARSMLQEIPLRAGESPVALRVSGVDLELIARVADVERTGSSDPAEPVSEWFAALFQQGAFTLPYSARLSVLVTQPAVADDLGFGFLDVDRFVSMSPYAFGEVGGYAGQVDVFALRSDMSELATTAGDDSIIDLGAGADGDADLDQRSELRPLGMPLRLGVDAQDSMISIAFSTATVESWLARTGDTLADVDDLFTAAAVLDLDDQLYAAVIDVQGRDAGDLAGTIDDGGWTSDDVLIAEDFTTVGWGASGVGDTQRTTIVYVFADDAAATASVEPITAVYAPDGELGTSDRTVADVFVLDQVDAVGRTVVVSGSLGPRGANEFTSLFLGVPRTTHR